MVSLIYELLLLPRCPVDTDRLVIDKAN